MLMTRASWRSSLGGPLTTAVLLLQLMLLAATLQSASSQPVGYQVLGNLPMLAVHHVQVPGQTDRIFYMANSAKAMVVEANLRPGANASIRSTRTFQMPDNPWCAEHAYDFDGNMLVVSGWFGKDQGLDSYRVYDKDMNLKYYSKNGEGRWYATLVTLPSGVTAVLGGTGDNIKTGGRHVYYLLWNHRLHSKTVTPVYFGPEYSNPTFIGRGSLIYYPMACIHPATGDLVIWSDATGAVIRADGPRAGSVVAVLPPLPDARLRTEYPYTASVTAQPIGPEDGHRSLCFVIFGGSFRGANKDTVASSKSYRLCVVHDPASPRQYTFGDGWEAEDIAPAGEAAMPKVLGYAIGLPNGQDMLNGGGKRGIAGFSNADGPHYKAYLYNPARPRGQRYTYLATSKYPRMYHSVSGLTTLGNALVTGCNDKPFIRYGTQALEALTPPFVDRALAITALSKEQLTYGEILVVSYRCPGCVPSPVTGAVLVTPSSNTHDMMLVQRRVRLAVAAQGGGWVSLVMPPNANVLVPGYYMLFLLRGDLYPQAKWIKLLPPAGFAFPTTPPVAPKPTVHGTTPNYPFLIHAALRSPERSFGAPVNASAGSRLLLVAAATPDQVQHFFRYSRTALTLKHELTGLCVTQQALPDGSSPVAIAQQLPLSLQPCEGSSLQRWIWRNDLMSWVSEAYPVRCFASPSRTLGTKVNTASCAADANSTWSVDRSGGGGSTPPPLVYQIRTRLTSPQKCVTARRGDIASIAACDAGRASQRFAYDPATGALSNPAAGACLGSKSLGVETYVYLLPCVANATSQSWASDPETAQLPLRGGAPRRCLDVRRLGTADGTRLVLYPCKGPRDETIVNQQWELVPVWSHEAL